MSTAKPIDVLVVGAGFGGLYALHRLRDQGFSVQGVEAGGDVGGTWYWNRYPGARCDVESFDYSFSLPDLQQDWRWTERYAAQPEILRYLEHVADRLDLRRAITFNTRIISATWDAGGELWRVMADSGEDILTRHLILATGALSAAKRPDIDGVEDFQGRVLNTSSWPHDDSDLSGLRVGVIGTGSSAIQAIPVLAEQGRRAGRLPADGGLQHPRTQRPARPPPCGRLQGALRRAPPRHPRDPGGRGPQEHRQGPS